MQYLNEQLARQGCVVGRLDQHRATSGHCRCDLVDDQVQRVVEGRHRDDDAQRFAGAEGQPRLGRAGQAHRHFLADMVQQLLDAQVYPVDRPGNLDSGVDQRLAALVGNQKSQFG